MNMFNISFLWMEISIVGGFFFAHHLVELGSFLASETIKEFQPAADAVKGTERGSAWWYKDSNHLQLHNTESLHHELSLDLIYSRSRAHMSVGLTMRDFPLRCDWWLCSNHHRFCYT